MCGIIANPNQGILEGDTNAISTNLHHTYFITYYPREDDRVWTTTYDFLSMNATNIIIQKWERINTVSYKHVSP